MMRLVPYRSDRENQAISGRAKWLFDIDGSAGLQTKR
jgi:hypothetical protein